MSQVGYQASPQKATAAANDYGQVIGPSVRLLGCLDVGEDVVFYGDLEGELRARRLIVKREAILTGTIVAEEVVIEGEVTDGQIFANAVALKAGCSVSADIYTQRIDIDAGALFEGKCRRHDNPLSLAPVRA